MRHTHPTLKAGAVHAYARHLLEGALDLESYQPAVPLRVVVSVLLLAACWQTSLTGACRLVRHRPSHHRVRSALYSCLPPRPRDLLGRVLGCLRRTLPDHLSRCPHAMAVDLHQRPFYGRKNTRGCTQRQKKAGTKKSFTYATLAVLDHADRFTVGLLPVRPHMRLTTIVERLLGQAEEFGLRASWLMLDKEFYSAEVIALLQEKGVAFLMPAARRASNRHLYQPTTAVGWYDYTWTAPLRKMDFKANKRHKKGKLTVTVRGCVARKPGTDEPLVYASWGLGKAWSPAQVVQAYRRRFGIETKYRQLGQCLARTTSTNERLRLLLVGVALVLANLWSYLHSEVFSRGPVGEREWHLGLLRLRELSAAVAADVAAGFGGWVTEWPAQREVPPALVPFLT